VFAWNGHGQCFFLIAEGRSKIPDQGNLRPRQGRLKAEAAVGITRRPIYMIYNKYIGINWQGKNDLPMFASVALSTATLKPPMFSLSNPSGLGHHAGQKDSR
jgi:hypothetical protein